MKLIKNDKAISSLQNILTIVFVSVLVISNVISSRIFNFFGYSMTSAVFLFPITYVLSDILSDIRHSSEISV